MKSLAVVLLAAAIVITGCASTNGPQDASGNKNSEAARIQMKAELDAMKVELQEMRDDMQNLKATVAGIQDNVHDLATRTNGAGNPGDGGNSNVAVGKTAQLFERAAEVSDVVRVWMGELNGVQFFICPWTKDKVTKVLNDQLGNDYVYMWLVIVNNNEKTVFKYDPKMALFRLEFESDTPGGQPKYVASFDPRQVLQVKNLQGEANALEDDFKERELLPGQTMDTYILFPKSVDFSKVKALYMNTTLIKELKKE